MFKDAEDAKYGFMYFPYPDPTINIKVNFFFPKEISGRKFMLNS